MPNHCHNRVTIYNDQELEEGREQIAKLKDIFEDEAIFTHFIPEPDWPNTPIMSTPVNKRSIYEPRGKVGELPVKSEDPWERYVFQSTGRTDDRWYDWRLQHWDTKWDAYNVEVTDDDPDQVEVEFDTAWSPPEAICHAIREQYPDLSVSWFYDEPGCEIAGYL